MSGSVHQSAYARFVSPEVRTFAFVPPNYHSEVADDSGIPFSPGCFSAYRTFDQIRQQIAECAPGSNFRQVDFRYTVHPPECSPGLVHFGFSNPYGYTIGLDRKKLSPEDFTKVLECCDQITQNPEQAILNTKACWEKLFPNEDLDNNEAARRLFRKYAEPRG